MKQTRKLTAVQASGGVGFRLRPLNLYSITSMIPKGLMRIMGLPVAEQQIETFKSSGITEVYQITQYTQNRDPLANRFGDGKARFGIHIDYTDPVFDETNNGSGDATLTNIEEKCLTGDSIWLPNDNLFEFDFNRVIEAHRDTKAVISVMTVNVKPRETIKNYGLIKADPNYKITQLEEKPKNEETLMQILGITDPTKLDSITVPINTAGSIIDNDTLAKIAKEKWIIEGRQNLEEDFDMAGTLIKKLAEQGYPIYRINIDAWGDLGSLPYWMDTFPEALGGKFGSIHKILETKKNTDGKKQYIKLDGNVWIHSESLYRKDKTGKTLEKRIKEGMVKLGPNVFIGRLCNIEDDVEIRYSDIEKRSTIRQGTQLDHVYLSPYCHIHQYSILANCALGLHITVISSDQNPTRIINNSVVGPEIKIPEGTTLDDVIIFPGYEFKSQGEIHSHMTLKPTKEQLNKILHQYLGISF